MEWLKRLFRSGEREPEPDATFDEVQENLETGSRQHHYLMCHRLLPQLAFDNPPSFIGMAKDADGLRFIWKKFGRTLPSDEFLAPSGIASELRTYETGHGPYSVALMTFPRPRRMIEVYHAAFTLGPLPVNSNLSRDELLEEARHIPARYFTLELGIDQAAQRLRTVFCEWTAQQSHLNYGDGPEPTLDAFYRQVCRHLEGLAKAPEAGFTPNPALDFPRAAES